MPYEVKRDPQSQNYEGDLPIGINGSSQPRRKVQITPAETEMESYAKAISVHVTGGGRAVVVYVPTDNADTEILSIEVGDGWVSDTAVRRVHSVTALSGSATVWGLFN